MRKRTNGFIWGSLALCAGLLAGCGSDDSPSGSGGSAVVTGRVDSEAEPASSSPAQASGPAGQAQASARTVVIGEVSTSGAFTTVAQANVESNGTFRIEGVPSGRSRLVVRARNESGAEVGSVVLHETTSAGAELKAPPITARTSVHARTYTQMRSSGSASAMSSAELSLFLSFRTDAEARAASSSAHIQAMANAAVRAGNAITAVLAAHGHASMTAEARATAFAAAAIDRDQDRASGVSVDAAQETFFTAAADALLGAGVSADALVLAYAGAATAFDAAMAETTAGGQARASVVREALLFSLRARARSATAVQGSVLGLRSATITTVGEIETSVRGAGTMTEIRAALAQERAEVEGRVVTSVLASLTGIGASTLLQIETQLRSTIASARLWTDLDGAVTAQATAQATTTFRTRVQAAVTAFVASLPTQTASTISADAVLRLMVALGAGASIQ